MIDVCALTRALVDIESVSNNEMAVAERIFGELQTLATRHDGRVEKMPVEGARFNVFAHWGDPIVTFSTHMDTVPPFFPSREDDGFIWGRGACDAKGIIASMICAAENLMRGGTRQFGLLFVVGEERNSAGAKTAALQPRGSRYLMNGEPTENKLALGSKGSLRLELSASGKTAHSGYPELGESAIEALLDSLEAIRKIPMPHDEVLGAGTVNIGTISGGRAPNVIADTANAEILIRLVGAAEPMRDAVKAAVGDWVQMNEVIHIPPMRFEKFDGLPTTVVSYTSDAPILSPAWGKPILIGPGSIHLAHTAEERIAKRDLADAAQIYSSLVRAILREEEQPANASHVAKEQPWS